MLVAVKSVFQLYNHSILKSLGRKNLLNKLDQRSEGTSRHAFGKIRHLISVVHNTGNVQMKPVRMGNKLTEKGGRNAAATCWWKLANVVYVGQLRVDHLLCVVSEDGHSPDTIACFRSRLLQNGEIFGAGWEDASGGTAKCNVHWTRQRGNVQN